MNEEKKTEYTKHIQKIESHELEKYVTGHIFFFFYSIAQFSVHDSWLMYRSFVVSCLYETVELAYRSVNIIKLIQ